MEFEVCGVRRSPGHFGSFNTFSDFRFWVFTAYQLGFPSGSVAYYNGREWLMPELSYSFEIFPYYALRRTGHEDVIITFVFEDGIPAIPTWASNNPCVVQ